MKGKKILSMFLTVALLFTICAGALQAFAEGAEGSVTIYPEYWYDAETNPYAGYAYFYANFTAPENAPEGKAHYAWSVVNKDSGELADDAYAKYFSEFEMYYLANGNYTVSVVVTYNGETYTDSFDFVVSTAVYYGELAYDIQLAEEYLARGGDNYTVESWVYFKNMYEAAKLVLENPDATQDEVDEADMDLWHAMNYLESINSCNFSFDSVLSFFRNLINRIIWFFRTLPLV